MSMWRILESKKATKEIDTLPVHILERYEFWRSVVLVSGPDGIRQFPGFKDHALRGQWQGFRSSSLNDSWRVIYQTKRNHVTVHVVHVNHHDYRRK